MDTYYAPARLSPTHNSYEHLPRKGYTPSPALAVSPSRHSLSLLVLPFCNGLYLLHEHPLPFSSPPLPAILDASRSSQADIQICLKFYYSLLFYLFLLIYLQMAGILYIISLPFFVAYLIFKSNISNTFFRKNILLHQSQIIIFTITIQIINRFIFCKSSIIIF